jgi:hypothetical protein
VIGKLTITSDFSDQTEAKLAADLRPMLNFWIWESIKYGAISLEVTNPDQALYVHVQVRDPELSIEGVAVRVLLFVYFERGATQATVLCHLGSEANVCALETKYRDFMKGLALEDKRSSLVQIDLKRDGTDRRETAEPF